MSQGLVFSKMINVIVLGGAGDVGSKTAEEMATYPEVKCVTIADRNEEAAHVVKRRIEHKAQTRLDLKIAEVKVAVVDAFNHVQMVEAIKGHDICASALGPFHLFECRCAKAAIDAGVDYCSVCDDWNAAADVIDTLHDEAQRHKVTCVTGFGATPGLSNMMIAMLAKKMDYPTEVEISCYQPLNAGGGEAVLRHMLFVMSGHIPVVVDGTKRSVKACSKTYKAEFTRFGPKTVWNMGHAEPATLHRYFPSLKKVEFRMGFGFGTRCLVWPAYLGLFNYRIFVWITLQIFAVLDWVMRRFPKGLGALRIDVRGVRDGVSCHEEAHGIGEMREITGLSLAFGARLMAQKVYIDTVKDKGGVYAPEGCMTEAFLQLGLAGGLRAFKSVDGKEAFNEDDFVPL